MDVEIKNAPAWWTEIRDRLDDQLAAIAKEETTDKRIASRSIRAVNALMHELLQTIRKYTFLPTEEVLFFKEVKPYFIGRGIYFSNLFKIESRKPPTSVPGLLQYYTDELAKVATVYEDHRFIHTYLESGSTHLDDKLFFRPGPDAIITMSGYEDPVDGAFPVCYDYVVGKLHAADFLKRHLLDVIETLNANTIGAGGMPKITFTLPKAALIELMYGLYARGCFNHGKAQLKDIKTVFEVAFNTKLENHPRTFQESLYRKSGRTVFLNSTIESLLRYIDQIEDKQIG